MPIFVLSLCPKQNPEFRDFDWKLPEHSFAKRYAYNPALDRAFLRCAYVEH